MKVRQVQKFRRLLNLPENRNSKSIPEEKQKGYLTECNVLMFVPKTEKCKQVFESVFDIKPSEHSIPELNYFEEEKGECKYRIEYLTLIIAFFKNGEEENNHRIVMEMAKDYPITFEGTEFKIILAPIVEN